MTRATRRRLGFLLAANLLLLIVIWALLKQGSSFFYVIARCFPDVAPVVLAGFALTGIIFTGAIDLSIASAIALAGTIFGWLVHGHTPPFLAFAGSFASAWAIMSFNGLLISHTRIPSIILTLAGLPFYRGLALILADIAIPGFSGNISVVSEAYHVPGKHLASYFLLIGLVMGLFLDCLSKRSRLWLALGNSPEACNLMGLAPSRILNSAFVFGGLFFGLSALLYVTRVQSIEPARMALGFELQVIAAVILGGTNIFGGEGSYIGTFLAAVFLYLVSQVLVYAGASAYLQDALTGGIILLIIGIDCALHRRSKLMEELA
jgi:simple sugar transport system permease protein